ncbi:MAG: acylneuraminate cytidylyltransferase family protein [Bacteroidia bacterium]|nr:acylneuraminate cytidylyltransferase family protein [Bacteroidia bacterium]
MYNGKKILAIITARAASKRLLNKNMLDFAGSPLISKTIESGKGSKYIDRLIVSTDSEEIKRISLEYGAEVPFIRPSELATDNADSIIVLNHVIKYINEKFNYILLLQPTSPLRTSEDIDNSIEMLNDEVKSIVSVSEMEHSPLWANVLPENKSMADFIKPEVKGKRSQDLPIYYRINGAIYISEMDEYFFNKGFLGKSTKAYIMPVERSVDIDNAFDFLFAEFLFKARLNNV